MTNSTHETPSFSEKAALEVLSLPMFPELTDGQVDAVIAAVRGWA